MGRILAALLGVFSAPQASEDKVQMVDPRTLYFSMSTIADEIGELEPVSGEPRATDFVMHEDEWRQIEFFPASRLSEMQGTLKQLARFEAENRHGEVYRNIFVRRIPVAPVLSAPDAVRTLASEFEAQAGAGPVLFAARSVTGRVSGGFTVPLSTNVALYGRAGPQGVMVLAANVGENGDHAVLSRAFITLNRKHQLIAVDWRSHMILTGVSTDGLIEVWQPT